MSKQTKSKSGFAGPVNCTCSQSTELLQFKQNTCILWLKKFKLLFYINKYLSSY